MVISLLALRGSLDIVLLYVNNYHIANGERITFGEDQGDEEWGNDRELNSIDV